jgi:hypothetical protein
LGVKIPETLDSLTVAELEELAARRFEKPTALVIIEVLMVI